MPSSFHCSIIGVSQKRRRWRTERREQRFNNYPSRREFKSQPLNKHMLEETKNLSKKKKSYSDIDDVSGVVWKEYVYKSTPSFPPLSIYSSTLNKQKKKKKELKVVTRPETPVKRIRATHMGERCFLFIQKNNWKPMMLFLLLSKGPYPILYHHHLQNSNNQNQPARTNALFPYLKRTKN